MGRNSYAGLCVGGPLAGKSIAYPHQKMPVALQPERCRDPKCPNASGPAHHHGAEEARYNWHHTGAQGFWIPEGETLHDAINTLATAYMEKCHGGR